MPHLEDRIKDLARRAGSDIVGIAAVERLADAPPSGDAAYLLPSARSVVAFAVALDPLITEAYLGKREWIRHCRERKEVVQRLYRIGDEVAEFLESEGFEAVNVDINNNYRPEEGAADVTEMTEFHPEFSLRYAGVAAGLGRLGWSGNLMTPDHGALVELGSVITSAPLESDPLLEESPCDRCKMCSLVCPVGMIDSKASVELRIAGRIETIARKRPNTCCWIGCTGYEGLHASGRWSNWSPYRLGAPLPEDDEELNGLCIALQKADPQMQIEDNSFDDFRRAVFDPDWFYMTVCGYCRGVCSPRRSERIANRRSIASSGQAALAADGRHVAASEDSVEFETPFGVSALIAEGPEDGADRLSESAGRSPMDAEVLRLYRSGRLDRIASGSKD